MCTFDSTHEVLDANLRLHCIVEHSRMSSNRMVLSFDGVPKDTINFLFEVFLSPLHLVSSNFWDDFFPLKFLLWIVYYRTHLCCCCLFCNQSRVRLAKSSWKKTGINRHAHAHVLVANSLVQLKRLHISIFVARSHVRTRLVAHSQASSSFFFQMNWSVFFLFMRPVTFGKHTNASDTHTHTHKHLWWNHMMMNEWGRELTHQKKESVTVLFVRVTQPNCFVMKQMKTRWRREGDTHTR